MKHNIILFISALAIGFTACNNGETEADAYGNFEATEVTISAEANGKIEFLKLEEGDELKAGNLVGLIDTVQLALSKQELLASEKTIRAKSSGTLSQIAVLKEQLHTAELEQTRVHNMLKDSAATQRQVDQADGQVRTLKQQINSVQAQNAPILKELNSVEVQRLKIEDQLKKSKIVNPINGTVLDKYAEANEVTAYGRPLYKIANLDELELRVYLTQTQLPEIKIGQTVQVHIDVTDGLKDYEGTVSWIASEAEFTPKVIQTKEERVNLVYAVKIKVKNDGALKIGMPAEVTFAK